MLRYYLAFILSGLLYVTFSSHLMPLRSLGLIMILSDGFVNLAFIFPYLNSHLIKVLLFMVVDSVLFTLLNVTNHLCQYGTMT
jgi:hypothetical protein